MSQDKETRDQEWDESGRLFPSTEQEMSLRIQRVSDIEEVREFMRNEIFQRKRIDIFHPPADMDAAVIENLRAKIDEICREVRNNIVWGIYSYTGELLKFSEFRLVEQLLEEDAEDFQELYLRGLRETPEVFGSTHEIESRKTMAQVREFMRDRHVVGVRHTHLKQGEKEEKLVAIANLRREKGVQAHIAHIGAMYVHPGYRKRSIAKSIMEYLIKRAADENVKIIRIIVTATNRFVIEMYERMGFKKGELQKGAAEHDGILYDWQHMQLDVDTYKKRMHEQERLLKEEHPTDLSPIK